MATQTTPLKRKSESSGPGTPWKTPIKGKKTEIDAYVLLVNQYFDIICQRAKDEKTRVRIMQKSVNKDEFISATADTMMIKLRSVFLSADKFLQLVNPHVLYHRKTMTLVSAEEQF